MDYRRYLNNIALDIKPSGIRKYFDVLSDMPNAISLGVGEPDFDTPYNVASAGIRSISEGRTQYTSNAGLPKLRAVISKYMAVRFDLAYTVDEIMVTVGASEGIDLALRALVNPLDEVLIPEPSFVAYSPLVRLAGGAPVGVDCAECDQFKLTAESLERAITPKTKALVLPFPNNPTGAIMTKEDLLPIVDVIRRHDLMVISDEIYAELTYGGKHCSIASLPDMWQRTIVLNGFSKTFAMTGWRLGFLCAPKPLRDVMLKIHQYCLMCAPSASQYAGLEALQSGLEDGFASVVAMRREYDIRRKYLVASLNEMGLTCFEPKGAFYTFPNVSATGMDSETFVETLLKEQSLAVIPGSAFGKSGKDNVRISYAYSMEQISEALTRLRTFVAAHHK
jgi:aminotransferase